MDTAIGQHYERHTTSGSYLYWIRFIVCFQPLRVMADCSASKRITASHSNHKKYRFDSVAVEELAPERLRETEDPLRELNCIANRPAGRITGSLLAECQPDAAEGLLTTKWRKLFHQSYYRVLQGDLMEWLWEDPFGEELTSVVRPATQLAPPNQLSSSFQPTPSIVTPSHTERECLITRPPSSVLILNTRTFLIQRPMPVEHRILRHAKKW